MNLEALQHLIRSAHGLAEDVSLLVLGSASLLASFPELGESSGPLASTYDADLCPDPFDELIAVMLDEALGENRAYFRIHGYHADILRDSILETLPQGWRERLVAVPGAEGAWALEPHDLVAVKLLVGRPKDLALVGELRRGGHVLERTVRERLAMFDLPVERLPRLESHFRAVFDHADGG